MEDVANKEGKGPGERPEAKVEKYCRRATSKERKCRIGEHE